MTYGRPGVYINETTLPALIAGTGSANAAGAVIGAFAQGPTALTLVTSWYDFVRQFGGYNSSYPATFGVGLFFQNGGQELYVKRIISSTAGSAAVVVPKASGTKTATVTAASYSGGVITYTATNTFSANEKVTITGLSNNSFNILDGVVSATGLSGSSFQIATTPSNTTAVTGASGTATTLYVASVVAKSLGSDGTNLRVQVQTGSVVNTVQYYNLTVTKENVVGTGSDVTNDTVLEVFNNVRFDSTTSSDYAPTVLSYYSKYVTIAVNDNVNAPTAGVYPLLGLALDGSAPVVADYQTAVAVDGTSPFDGIDRPLVLFAPEIQSILGGTDGPTLANSMIAWANYAPSGYVVLDTTSGVSTSVLTSFASARTASSQAAIYYPNVYIADPTARSTTAVRLVGPAGAVVGQYLATDKAFGPFKAPAGLSTNLAGVVGIEKTLSSTDLDTLNSATKPVNAIRQLPGAGVVVMGARTLLQDGTANRYVNMRRSLIYIKKRLDTAAKFALFENNDEILWGRLRSSIGFFLNEYRNQGGLRGATPDAAFYVKCDAENNTAQTIALGEVHIEVGVALQYPAEFIVINLSQKTAS
jgi:hypothetical protein